MKIKVGDKIYDGTTEPIMVILTDADKSNIINMNKSATRYADAPDGYFKKTEDFLAWMREGT